MRGGRVKGGREKERRGEERRGEERRGERDSDGEREVREIKKERG